MTEVYVLIKTETEKKHMWYSNSSSQESLKKFGHNFYVKDFKESKFSFSNEYQIESAPALKLSCYSGHRSSDIIAI